MEIINSSRLLMLLMLTMEVVVPDASDGFLVSLEHADVIHVALPILDITAMISCYHPLVPSAPSHTTDRKVVRLKS